MSTKWRMMMALPEVRHLVDRVPVAAARIKGSAVHLRYFQHCRDEGVPMRDQLRALDIPWHARKIPTEFVDMETRQDAVDSVGVLLAAAGCLPASAFAQCMPRDAVTARQWGDAVVAGIQRLTTSAAPPRIWLAHNAMEAGEEIRGLAQFLRADEPVTTKIASLRKRRPRYATGGVISVAIDHRHMINFQSAISDAMEQQFVRGIVGFDPASRDRSTPFGDFVVDRYPDRFSYNDGLGSTYDTGGRFIVYPLTTRDDFSEEGATLNHCARGYFEPCSRGESIVASVRSRQGARFATIEIDGEGRLVQSRGFGNRPITEPEVNDIIESYRHHVVDLMRRAQTAPEQPERREFNSAAWTGDWSE